MTWRRLGALLRAFPRESVTTRSVMGPEYMWSDQEHLLADAVDRVGYLAWMFARANFKDIPKKPPKPVRRPGDLGAAPGEEAVRNLSERESLTASSMTFEEMDRAIETQTGRAVAAIGMHT